MREGGQKPTLPSSTCWLRCLRSLAGLGKNCYNIATVKSRGRTIIQCHNVSCTCRGFSITFVGVGGKGAYEQTLVVVCTACLSSRVLQLDSPVGRKTAFHFSFI